MFIHLCIMEDMSRSLVEMSDVLEVPVQEHDDLQVRMVRDARIYSFLRCVEVFKAVLTNIYQENEFLELDELDEVDVEDVVNALVSHELLEEEHAQQCMNMFGLASFLMMEKSWLQDKENLELFEAGIKAIPGCYDSLCLYLQNMSDTFQLIEEEEGEEDVH